jgi:dihydroorotase-like cyclic amidohydrolase
VERLERRRSLLAPKAVIDFGLYGAAGQDNVPHIPGLAKAGIVAFKSFLREVYGGREVNFEGSLITDDGALYRVAREVAATGLPWTVHAENEAIIQSLMAELAGERESDPLWFARVRPELVEEEATRKAILYGKAAGARTHIVHVTSKAAVAAIAEARAAGQAVSGEACIPHLMMTEEAIRTLGVLGCTTPRLRTAEDQGALWEGLRRGWLSTIATDHASYTAQDMDVGWEGTGFAHAGYGSIEHALSLVLSRANEGVLTLEQLTRCMSENPARLFGLWPRKGGIQVGADADLVLVDLQKRGQIDQREMYSKAKISPFEGWELTGQPVMTIPRGRVIMADGRVTGEPGYGEFLRPE